MQGYRVARLAADLRDFLAALQLQVSEGVPASLQELMCTMRC